MKCQSVQTWLLQVDTLHVKDWPRNMNRHLKKCPACAKTARLLYKIEEGWRNLPTPAECETAKAEFLDKLASQEKQNPEKREKTSRRQKRAKRATIPIRRTGPYRWVGAAAVVLVGIILTGLLLPGKTQASSDVVERLIDWNLEMTNADAVERKRLLEEHEAKYIADLKNATLSDEERALAEELLESARKLASADDPVVEAEVVKKIADKLFSRAEASDKLGNKEEFERCGLRFMRYKEFCYEPMKVRIAQFKLPDTKKNFDKGGPEKSGFDKGGFKGFEKGGHDFLMNQKKQFEKIFEHPPEFSRPDLNKKFEGFSKKGGFPPKMGGRK